MNCCSDVDLWVDAACSVPQHHSVGSVTHCSVAHDNHTGCIYSSLDECTGQTFENTEASQAISLLKRPVLTGVGLNSVGMCDSGRAYKVQICWCWALPPGSPSIDGGSVISSCLVSFGPPLQPHLYI